MFVKKVVLLCIFVAIISAQVKIVDFNCVKVGLNNQCIKCKNGSGLKGKRCTRLSKQGNNDTGTVITCSVKDGCTQAKSFGNQEQLKDFIRKYTSPPPPPPKNSDFNTQPGLTVQPDIINQPEITSQSSSSSQSGGGSGSQTTQSQSSSSSGIKIPNSISVKPSPVQFSQTTVVVKNVDEADLIKTDGTYIYTISNQVLSIILAYPASDAKVMSTIRLYFVPQAIFIQGDVLAVFGTVYFNQGQTFIRIYDIKNRIQPNLLKQYKVSGQYFQGRKLNNGYMYLITKYVFDYNIIIPWYDFGFGRLNIPAKRVYWYPWNYVTISGVNIISFNLAQPLLRDISVAALCIENLSILYMSEKAMYLATNSNDSTKISKILINQNQIRPIADTKVLGITNNQFSLDESGNFLRIATTSFNSQNFSNVFVLDYYLRLEGSITGIAPKERIYSCRYVGNRLYMVTFRNIDPFFVINLANPKNPIILGELKITGFSRFLYPYDQNTIIGIGRQADNNGRQEGLKISIFNVSDAKNPNKTDFFQVEEKFANSHAEWEHKAFLLAPKRNLLVIPVNMNHQIAKFNGVFAFHVSPNKISFMSLIDHLKDPSDNFNIRNVERSLYIQQFVYTKSKCLLKINKIETMQQVKDVDINCS